MMFNVVYEYAHCEIVLALASVQRTTSQCPPSAAAMRRGLIERVRIAELGKLVTLGWRVPEIEYSYIMMCLVTEYGRSYACKASKAPVLEETKIDSCVHLPSNHQLLCLVALLFAHLRIYGE